MNHVPDTEPPPKDASSSGAASPEGMANLSQGTQATIVPPPAQTSGALGGTTGGGSDSGNGLPGSGSSGGGDGTEDTPKYVRFTDENQVFDTSIRPSGQNVQTLDFLLSNKTVTPTNLNWYVSESSSGNLRTISSVSVPTEEMGILSLDDRTSTDRKARLDFDAFKSKFGDDFGEVMILAVNWTVNGLSGSTLSPAFSVVESTAEIDAVRAQLQVSPYAKSTERPNEGGTSTHGGVAPSLPTGAGGGDANGTASIPKIESGHHGGGGLSTGAIVGIAVGVGVAALLAAALGLFFFLRRRKGRGAKGRDGAASAEQEKLSTFMVASKDNNTNGSDPAITPYRDEQQNSAAAARGRGDEREALEQPHVGSESASRAGTPHGVSRHLVEDGMTEDEIRRLEEEERQLDDEIQRAGGRR